MSPLLLNPLPKIFQLDQHLRAQDVKPAPDGAPHPIIAMFEEVLRRARAGRRRPDEASALTDLGRVILQTGDPQRALPLLEAALPIYREQGDTEREGLTLELVAMCHQALGDLPRAAALIEQSLHIAEEAGNQELSASRVLALGALLAQQRQPERACPCFEKGMKLAESLRLDPLLGLALLRLGETYSERGRPTESIPYYQRAITVWQHLGNAVQEQVTRARLGLDMTIAEQGPVPVSGRRKRSAVSGLELMMKAAEALIEMKQWVHVPVLADNIGQLFMNQGNRKGAAEWFQRALTALDHCHGMLPIPSRGTLLYRLAFASHLGGDAARARAHYQLALPLLLQEGNLRDYTISQGNLGTLLIAAGQKAGGAALLKEAAESAAHLGDPQLLGQSLANLGLCYFHAGRRQEALPILQESLDPLRRSGDSHSLGLVLQALDALRAVAVVEYGAGPPPHGVN